MSIIADPARVRRLVPRLVEATRTAASFDPDAAEDLAWLAGFLEGVAAAPLLAAPSPPSKPKRPRAVTGVQIREAENRATAWITEFKEGKKDEGEIPSARAILKAAKDTGIPRSILLAARPPEWKVNDKVRQ
jgi:hypothetical protein